MIKKMYGKIQGEKTKQSLPNKVSKETNIYGGEKPFKKKIQFESLELEMISTSRIIQITDGQRVFYCTNSATA